MTSHNPSSVPSEQIPKYACIGPEQLQQGCIEIILQCGFITFSKLPQNNLLYVVNKPEIILDQLVSAPACTYVLD